MKTSTWSRTLTASSLLALAVLAACGDDSADGASSTGAGGGDVECGTAGDPTIFTVADVAPAAGAVVDGASVVHAFRVVRAQGLVQQLNFEPTANHTAGLPEPAELTFTVTQDGSDLIYTATPVTWTTAGHVELSVRDAYKVEGCAYAFPEPLFSYDVQPPGEGGGGDAAGTGGLGQGGAG